MLDKPKTVNFWHGRLPHWEVEDGKYFVTIHLAGAIPQQGQQRIHELSLELAKADKKATDLRLRLQRRIFKEMEAWLDRVDLASHLQLPEVAKMIIEAISFRGQRDWHVLEFVLMPSHIHLFFDLIRSDLKTTVEEFKRWTGHQAAKLIQLPRDRFWQDEWFDHWSRSEEESERIIDYIRRNPEKAGLVKDYSTWPYGSWSGK